ncbi:MAG: hypothetical protein ACRCWM_03300 [Sarcina sp.]
MNKFTDQEIENTIKMLNSLILNCEKIQPKLKVGSPQLSLNKNRIEALYIAVELIKKEKYDYEKEYLQKALVQITSILNKSKSGISHAKESSGTYTRFRKIIEAMTIAISYIEDSIIEKNI